MSQWDLLYLQGYRVYTGFGLQQRRVIPRSGVIRVDGTAFFGQRDATRAYINPDFFYGNLLWN
jgi:hypothetical protein